MKSEALFLSCKSFVRLKMHVGMNWQNAPIEFVTINTRPFTNDQEEIYRSAHDFTVTQNHVIFVCSFPQNEITFVRL